MTAKTISLQAAADMLFTCPETVSEYIRFRGLPAVKIGRAWVLVDEDVISWVRAQYGKGDVCASTSAASAVSGGSMGRSRDSELQEALAPRTERKRRNGQPRLRSIGGGKPALAKSPDSHGAQQS